MSANVQQSPFDDGIPSYLGRLTQAPLLSADEEVALTRAVQKGDSAARQKLVESNMRLVINIAKAYRNRALPLEDLIQEGAVGLMHAAERFDPDRGFRFSTYATHWIKQAIGRAIDNKSKAIRLPAHVTQSIRKVERARELLTRELGQEPSTEQLAQAMGLSLAKLLALLQASQELLSLDMTIGDSGGVTLGGLIKDPGTHNLEAGIVSEEMVEELHRILSELNEREQKIIRLKLPSLDRSNETSDPAVAAEELKLSRERMRQIEVQAIKKLRALALRRRTLDHLRDSGSGF